MGRSPQVGAAEERPAANRGQPDMWKCVCVSAQVLVSCRRRTERLLYMTSALPCAKNKSGYHLDVFDRVCQQTVLSFFTESGGTSGDGSLAGLCTRACTCVGKSTEHNRCVMCGGGTKIQTTSRTSDDATHREFSLRKSPVVVLNSSIFLIFFLFFSFGCCV